VNRRSYTASSYWPDDDAHLVVLCNIEGLADEVCDQVVAAWKG